MQFLRNEYPRPQFKRAEWFTLNGEWEFAFDDDNVGIKQRSASAISFGFR